MYRSAFRLVNLCCSYTYLCISGCFSGKGENQVVRSTGLVIAITCDSQSTIFIFYSCICINCFVCQFCSIISYSNEVCIVSSFVIIGHSQRYRCILTDINLAVLACRNSICLSYRNLRFLRFCRSAGGLPCKNRITIVDISGIFLKSVSNKSKELCRFQFLRCFCCCLVSGGCWISNTYCGRSVKIIQIRHFHPAIITCNRANPSQIMI